MDDELYEYAGVCRHCGGTLVRVKNGKTGQLYHADPEKALSCSNPEL
jgi:hypothetical protein